MSVISNIHELTPSRLERILVKNGIEATSTISAVEPIPTNNDSVFNSFQLRIYYKNKSIKQAPSRLFLKISEPQMAFISQEVFFYTDIFPRMKEKFIKPPFAHCYEAYYDPGREQSHILLSDYSRTHLPAIGPMPPAIAHCEEMVDILGLVHGFWWENPILGNGIGEFRAADHIRSMVNSANHRAKQFLNNFGDRYSPRRREVIKKVTTGWPERRLSRYLQKKGVTLIHREAHAGNFIFPKPGGSSPVLLTNWQSWRVDTGTDDLAMMMAANWYPERRERLEVHLLKRYHAKLLELGVADYSWADCFFDYRASIARMILILTGGWRRRRDPALYFDKLEKCLAAYEDLNCDEVFLP